jgi:hypothetical protein
MISRGTLTQNESVCLLQIATTAIVARRARMFEVYLRKSSILVKF